MMARSCCTAYAVVVVDLGRNVVEEQTVRLSCVRLGSMSRVLPLVVVECSMTVGGKRRLVVG